VLKRACVVKIVLLELWNQTLSSCRMQKFLMTLR
jgi:hypothetical protein